MATTKGTVEISRSNARRIIDLLPMILSPNAVVFDIETTGLQKSRNEIVSFAAKSPVNEDGVQTLIMPKRPQQLLKKDSEGKCAYDINGIHPDDLVGSPTFEEVYPLIRQELEGKHWICWNAEFDVEFLDKICDRRNLARIPRAGVTCAMELLSPLAGLRGQRRGRIEKVVVTEDADDRYRRQKLSGLAKRMGIDTRQAHDAAADVDMTIKIMKWASESLKSLAPPRKSATIASRKTKPVRTQKMAEVTLIYSREGKNGQYWVLQPDHDVDGEAFLFENQLEQKRFAKCKRFIVWLKSMPTGCISLPPAKVLIETTVNSQGYTRVASLQCGADISEAKWRANVSRKRRLFSRGWQVGSEWTRDLSEAIILALERDGYAYSKE
ncbi:MAG: 3'-5' exonuclease [Chloroflexota bacterium]|nr:3'-5' exonuclease [Chloroflexota bacterium]